MAHRKTHRKSKLGCQNCKQRHIKCDEGQPACTKCTTAGRQCVYETPNPRRFRSTLRHESTPSLSIGINPATVSPSSTLLSPISARDVALSTPSSFAASPVFTPAASLQNDPSYSMINTQHLELMSNFILEVVPSLDDTNSRMGDAFMHTMMPIVLSKSFLLLQVLALSALRLSQTRSEQRDKYLSEATTFQIEALTLFEHELGTIDNNNCQAMLLFTSLLGIHSLGEAVMSSENDANSFLGRFITYLNLHRGVRTVTSQAWNMLLLSNISPVLHHALGNLSHAELHNPDEAAFVAEELNHLLDISDMSAESDSACRDAVSRLKLIYQADHLRDQSPETQHQCPGLIWAWPTLLSGVFTSLLEKRQPEALIILCYFAVPLYRRRSLWFVAGAGRLLIEFVTRWLGSFWRYWLQWPNKVIGSDSVYHGR